MADAERPEQSLSRRLERQPGQSPRHPAAMGQILVALLFGQSLFLILLAAQILYRGLREAWVIHHLPSVYAGDPDFPFYRIVLLSVLPFAFNFAFGVVFGRWFHDDAHGGAPSRALTPASVLRRAVFNRGLVRAVGWWVLFVLPLLITKPPSPRAIIFPFAWSPEELIMPLRIELGLFFPMGTLGLWAGFSLALMIRESRTVFAPDGARKAPNKEREPRNEAPFQPNER